MHNKLNYSIAPKDTTKLDVINNFVSNVKNFRSKYGIRFPTLHVDNHNLFIKLLWKIRHYFDNVTFYLDNIEKPIFIGHDKYHEKIIDACDIIPFIKSISTKRLDTFTLVNLSKTEYSSIRKRIKRLGYTMIWKWESKNKMMRVHYNL